MGRLVSLGPRTDRRGEVHVVSMASTTGVYHGLTTSVKTGGGAHLEDPGHLPLLTL